MCLYSAVHRLSLFPAACSLTLSLSPPSLLAFLLLFCVVLRVSALVFYSLSWHLSLESEVSFSLSISLVVSVIVGSTLLVYVVCGNTRRCLPAKLFCEPHARFGTTRPTGTHFPLPLSFLFSLSLPSSFRCPPPLSFHRHHTPTPNLRIKGDTLKRSLVFETFESDSWEPRSVITRE